MPDRLTALATPAARLETATAPYLRVPMPDRPEVDCTAPTIRIVLPDGGQAHLPGFTTGLRRRSWRMLAGRGVCLAAAPAGLCSAPTRAPGSKSSDPSRLRMMPRREQGVGTTPIGAQSRAGSTLVVSPRSTPLNDLAVRGRSKAD